MKDSIKKFVSISGLFIVIAVVLISSKQNKISNVIPTATAAPTLSTSFESQTAQLGEVAVEVTPIKISQDKENIFSVAFNTHVVNLDFDFSKIITLTDDLGNTYQAISWSGGSGGHHLSGEITFPKLKNSAKKAILTISRIEGKQQNFNWEVR